jgi:4-amino-4-deoxy-L-arabinose transferase-like glycosyltransferase
MPTNGFHPLYLTLLIPIFGLGESGDLLPVRLAIIFLTCCYFATAFVIHLLVRQLAGQRAGVVAAIAWAANPLFIFFARGGLEAALYVLLATLLCYVYVRHFRDQPTYGQAVVMGTIGGFVVLSRTDGLLLVLAIGADFALRTIRGHVRLWKALGLATTAALMLFLIVSPWILWNLETFGTISQTSAEAHRFGVDSNRSVLRAISVLTAGSKPIVFGTVLLGCAIAAFSVRYFVSLRGELARRLREVSFLLTYLVAFGVLVFGWYRWYRSWYFLLPAMALLLILAVLLLAERNVSVSLRKQGTILFGLIWVGAALLGLVQFAQAWHRGPMWMQDLKQIVTWAEANTEEDAVVGSFNAGMIGYFLPRKVVNLDGLVNNEVLAELEHGDLGDYLTRTGIDYVVDKAGYVNFFFGKYARDGTKNLVKVEKFNWSTAYRVVRE